MTVEEMEATLDRLGIEVISVRGDEINGHCPAHLERTGKEDRNPSWFINADTGQHICFSCKFKGGLYALISYVEGIEFEKAKEWMGSSGNLLSRFERVTADKKPVLIDELTNVTESMLAAFVDPPEDALLSRGLTSNAARAYELLWDPREGNWITPIRDPLTERLLGWQEKGYLRRYFNNRPAKIKKSLSLFGYSQYVTGSMIVVESPLDVVRLASLGITGGVSTYGSAVSTAQFNLIRGAERIVFAMDNDQAGKQSSRELFFMCKEMGVDAWFFDYRHTDMKDVGGMSRSEVESGLKNARHIVKGLKVTS